MTDTPEQQSEAAGQEPVAVLKYLDDRKHYIFRLDYEQLKLQGTKPDENIEVFIRPPITSELETKLRAEIAMLKVLLKEGADGFGRILISTSDDKAVRDWQKRSRLALSSTADTWLNEHDEKVLEEAAILCKLRAEYFPPTEEYRQAALGCANDIISAARKRELERKV